jgi:hypothetical protein
MTMAALTIDRLPFPLPSCYYEISLTATEGISAGGSAACLRCWPIGDNGVNEDSVGKVGKAFVVNLLWRPALSAVDVEAVGICVPIGRIVDEYVGKDDSFCGDLRPLENAMLGDCKIRFSYQHGMSLEMDGLLWGGNGGVAAPTPAVLEWPRRSRLQFTLSRLVFGRDSQLKDIYRAPAPVVLVNDKSFVRKESSSRLRL